MRLWPHHAGFSDFFHEIKPLVLRALPYNAALQRIVRNARTSGQQLSAAIGTIAVHRHCVPFVLIKRLSVAHAEDMYFLTVRLCHVYFVVDTRSRIKVEREVLEAQPLCIVLCIRWSSGDFIVLHQRS